MDRSAAIDIPGTVSDRPPDKDSPTDPGKKKRGFQPLKSIKKFFSKKKDKKEDSVTGVGIKSKSYDALETHAAAPGNNGPPLGGKSLSMSADSVFNNDKIREDSLIPSGSMSHLPQANFKDELARKLGGRRHDDRDEGLPASPPGHTTTIDAIMENGLKEKSHIMDSENSLLSMDSSEAELEEDFFQSGWSGAHTTSHSELPVNLDVVASTSSLNTSAARHKIAIKPKTKRASAMVAHRKRTTAPPKPLNATAAMPQLREESPPKTIAVESEEDISADLTESGADTSHDLTQTTDIEELEESLSTSPPKVTSSLGTSVPPVSSPVSIQQSIGSPSPKVEVVKQDDPEASSPPEVQPRDDEVTTKAEETVVLHHKPAEILRPKDPDAVVLRPDSLGANRDTSKRQTVAIGTKDTVFGDRKVKRTSLIAEDRDWESLGKPKDKSPDEEQGSEFASVFAKFRRNASQRKGPPEQEAKSFDKKAVNKSDNAVEKPSITSKVASIKTTNKLSVESSEQVAKPSVSSQENKIVPHSEHTTKTTDKHVERKPTTQSKTLVIQKSNDAEVQENKDTLETSKRNSAEHVKRESLEAKKRNSAEKSPRESLEIGKKRDSVENKRNSSDKSPRESLDISKRNSTEVKKDTLQKADSDPKPLSVVDSKKEEEGLTKRINKFVSVQQKSVPLNDKTESTHSTSQPKTTDATTHSAPPKSKVVQVVEKDKPADSSKAKDINLATPSDNQTANKRESPRPTNRYRSQTLPEATVVVAKEPGPKRANSQDNGINKENIPQNSSSSSAPHKATTGILTRPAGSTRPEPHKLTQPASDTGVKAQPAWVSLAKKHTGSWEDKEKELETKSKKDLISDEEKGAKRASVLDLMKRFQ